MQAGHTVHVARIIYARGFIEQAGVVALISSLVISKKFSIET